MKKIYLLAATAAVGIFGATHLFNQSLLVENNEAIAASSFNQQEKPPKFHQSIPLFRYQEGVHYRELKHPFKTKTPELREIFSYACPHCDALRPVIHALRQANVGLYESPMPFMQALKPDVSKRLAAGLVVANNSGNSGAYSDRIFHMIHRENVREFSDADIVSILELALKKSNKDTYDLLLAAKGSVALVDDLKIATDLLVTNKEIPGVPSLIVNGTYVIDIAALSKEDLVHDIIELTRFLQERKNVPTTP